MTTEPDDKIMQQFAAVVQTVGERCLADAQRDDPHLVARAMQLIGAGEGRLRMTIDFSPIARTHLLLVDSEGEPLMSIYTLTGRAETAPAH
jgi:hypothetical protein